jgi:hypothetical protein
VCVLDRVSDFREALKRGFDAHEAKPADRDNLAFQLAARNPAAQ